MKNEINTILAGGGGLKSLAYIGVLKKLEEIKEKKENTIIINIKTFAGVSAGSIIGFLYLLGYSSKEMEEEIVNIKLHKLKDITFLNFVTKFGIDSGNNIIEWINILIIKKKFDINITFLELFNIINIDFQIFATNLQKYNLTKFNYIETPNLKITDAIRMSISIPFMFTINKYNLNTKQMDNENGDIHVDGGLVSPYPIYLFKNNLDTTLGFKLVNDNNLKNTKININGIEDYSYHIMACFVAQRNKYVLSKMYKKHTLFIDIQNITKSLNFKLSTNKKKKLIQIGYDEMNKYLLN